MAVYRYPQEVHDLVKEWAPKLRDRELAALVNDKCGTSFTDQSMKAFRGNHGYRNGMKQWTGAEYWKYQTKYPQGMYEYIRDNSWGVSSKEMAERVKELFGYEMTPTCMKQFRQRHGIKSGVTDVQLSPDLPEGVRCLAGCLRRDVMDGSIDPFRFIMRDQAGVLRSTGDRQMSPEEIMHMDWLCDCVDGEIPGFDSLKPIAQNLVRVLGIYRDQIPPEKEGVLL